MSRRIVILLALAGLPFSSASAQSNPLFLFNGIDAVSSFPATQGQVDTGVLRCFDADLFHSPVRAPAGAGAEYSAVIEELYIGIDSSQSYPGYQVRFPLISLTSSSGSRHLIGEGGNQNFTFGFSFPFPNGHRMVIGPLDGASGVKIHHLLLDQTPSAPSHSIGSVDIYTIPLDPPVHVPEGHSVLVYVADDEWQTGPQTRQHFAVSNDERNLCRSYSFKVTQPGDLFSECPSNEEWCIGLGMRQAVTSPTVSATSGSSANASHLFDGGSGARTVSLTGTTPELGGVSLGAEELGFVTYDVNHPNGGCARLVMANIKAINRSCNDPGIDLPTGGFGGPSFGSSIHEDPRIPIKIDVMTNTLLASPWVVLTMHDTVPGGVNQPWAPVPAGTSGATGVTGGATQTVPPLPSYVGVELAICSLALDAHLTDPGGPNAIDVEVGDGDSHSLTTTLTFYP